jgi:hypothetical protein
VPPSFDLKKALVGAAFAHMVILLAIASRTRGERAPLLPPAGTFELEVDAPVAGAVPPEAPRAPPPSSLAPGDPALRRVASSLGAAASAPLETGAREDAAGPPAAPPTSGVEGVAASAATQPDDEGWTFSPLTAPAVGLAASARRETGAALRAAAEGRSTPSGAAAAASLHQLLDEHDRAVGLGSGGPLVNLARTAVRDSLVPSVSHALFELCTDGAGVVLSVRVLDSSSDRRAWDDVAAKLAESARAHPLRVPPGGRGMAVTLQVDSVVHTKSAHDAGETSVSLFGVPIKKSRAPNPVNIDLSVPVASMNIDPTDALLDATTKADRIVSAWIVAERRL